MSHAPAFLFGVTELRTARFQPSLDSRTQVAAPRRGTCVSQRRAPSGADANPLSDPWFWTCVGHSSKPVDSTPSAPCNLREQCRQGLIESKIESIGELRLTRLRATTGTRARAPTGILRMQASAVQAPAGACGHRAAALAGVPKAICGPNQCADSVPWRGVDDGEAEREVAEPR